MKEGKEGVKGGTRGYGDSEERRKRRSGAMEGEVQERTKAWRKEWKV